MFENTPQATTKQSFLNREPVAIMYVIQTGIALAMGFGFDISIEQMALLLTFTGAVLTMLTRQQVTPFAPVGTTPQAPVSATPDLTPIVAEANPSAHNVAPIEVAATK